MKVTKYGVILLAAGPKGERAPAGEGELGWLGARPLFALCVTVEAAAAAAWPAAWSNRWHRECTPMQMKGAKQP